MAVRVGASYVSEAALSYARAQAADKEKADSGGVLKGLAEKFPQLKITLGTAPFSGTGTNNVAISPQIIKQMANDPDKRLEYEALLYDIANLNKPTSSLNGNTPKASGFVIGDDGGLRGWSISPGNDAIHRRSNLLEKHDKKNWWQQMLGQAGKAKKPAAKAGAKAIGQAGSQGRAKQPSAGAATVALSAQGLAALNHSQKAAREKQNFRDTNELMGYLRDNYAIVKNGGSKISGQYLRACVGDEAKRQKLFENLKVADESLKYHQENTPGFQQLSIEIDENGDMTMMSSSGTVTFNAEKRARQIAAAQSADDIATVMRLLETDLSQCEEGRKNNMCDEAEVEKVKKMIERAQKRKAEVSANEPKEKDLATEAAFSVSLLI